MTLTIQTLQHFAVDGICGASLAYYAVHEEFLAPIIFYFGLYNLIAFGTQWLIGSFIDRKFLSLRTAFIISLACLTIGIVSSFGILMQSIFLGIGNSIFHVAGGSIVLRRYQTFKQLGIFVSSGAIGLALGLNSLVDAKIFLAVDFLATMYILKKLDSIEFPNAMYKEGNFSNENSSAIILCAVLLLSCVVLRGFGRGIATDFVMLFPCVLAIGKALGGFVADSIGYRKTILVIFFLGFISLQFDGLIPILTLTLAFNMTMPLTLRLVHWCNPKFPAMMFGLAAGCLLPGAFFTMQIPSTAMITIQFLTLFIAGILVKKYSRENFDDCRIVPTADHS